MKTLKAIEEAIKNEINKLKINDSYENTTEAETQEHKILNAYKTNFNYNIELDINANNYFLKALFIEVWQYHINVIIPRLKKKHAKKKTNHFICKVKDSLNNFDLIGSVYCDVKTVLQAKQYFKKHPFIKKHIGNKRYQITFRQNPHLLQDSE